MITAAPSRRRSFVPALAAAAMGAVLLSGCSIVEPLVKPLIEGPAPETPKRETPASPEAPPQLVPGGTAEENLPYFTEVLRDYSAGDGPVQGAPIVQAVTEAGFDPAMMQVSFDTSKTGLPADNIFVSVRFGGECLIGQVVAADRSFVAKNEPAIGPNADICLIGETAPIG